MDLQGKRVAVLVEQLYQEMEVWYPIYRLREAGCTVTVIGPEAGQSYPSKLGYPCCRAAVESMPPTDAPLPLSKDMNVTALPPSPVSLPGLPE